MKSRNTQSHLERPRFEDEVNPQDKIGREVYRERISGMIPMLMIFVICGGVAILALIEANPGNSYQYGTLTPTAIPSGIICLAENIFHEPLKVWGEGSTVLGEIPVGDTIYITYENYAVYYLLPDEQFTSGYVSARRVKLLCHNIDYALTSD